MCESIFVESIYMCFSTYIIPNTVVIFVRITLSIVKVGLSVHVYTYTHVYLVDGSPEVNQ